MNAILTQTEADELLAMEKHCIDNFDYLFPVSGGELRIVLRSKNGREEFILDISRSRFELSKDKFQLRARKSIILARIDVNGPPHKNPDRRKIPSPHIHIYREGENDDWAEPLSRDFFDPTDLPLLLDQFFDFCNICTKPNVLFI